MAEDTPKSKPLAEFLIEQRNNGTCWCETVPPEVVGQIDEAARGGSRQWAAMRRWLAQEGYPCGEGRFDGHFRRNHHLETQ